MTRRNPPMAEEKKEKKGLFARLREGLSKTRDVLTGRVDTLVRETRKIDEEFYEELEDILIMSDCGMKATMAIMDELRERVSAGKIKDAETARQILKDIMIEQMNIPRPPLRWPMVMLVVGVNGVGKTTTIGKLALRFQDIGRRIILCAGDTFRAAAAEQLTVWAQRARVPIVKHAEGADPAAVVFDGVKSAKAQGADLLIVDTAGRLHNKKNLMDELNKMRRVIDREYPEADVRCILVLDATTGQNGLAQARAFKEVCEIGGIILTKLDGTAKGGIALAIRQELNVPVWYIGVGEGIEDLQPFNAKDFVEALF
ncbi:MAG: signal recognition particle-docking protein FtsY [Clostridia bacterium]|nr:signal recognition particle-docking protein FtsY [Clostridia bacterium]